MLCETFILSRTDYCNPLLDLPQRVTDNLLRLCHAAMVLLLAVGDSVRLLHWMCDSRREMNTCAQRSVQENLICDMDCSADLTPDHPPLFAGRVGEDYSIIWWNTELDGI